METLLQQMKVAAALVLLRSKPEKVSAKQHTERICSEFLQKQSQWKAKYLEAKDTILHLQQQQAVTQLQSQSDNFWVAVLLATGDCPPSPPPSQEHQARGVKVVQVENERHHLLTTSYQFINSVVSLSRAVKNFQESNKTNITQFNQQHQMQGLSTLLSETVPTCVHLLLETVALRNKGIPPACVLDGLKGLVLLVNCTDTFKNVNVIYMHCHSALLQHFALLVDNLLKTLLATRYEADIRPQERQLLERMLIFVVKNLKAPEKYDIIDSLVDYLKTHCGNLRQSQFDSKLVDPDCYECIGFTLHCLQHGIESLKMEEIQTSILTNFQAELETAVLHLTEPFPLLAQAVWRVDAAIEMALKSLQSTRNCSDSLI